jgi:hypothetical protein
MPGPSRDRWLHEELAAILSNTQDGSLRWRTFRHPEDGEIMLWKAPWGEGYTLYLTDDPDDGGPSLAIYDDEDVPGTPDGMVMLDHLHGEDQNRLRQIVELVAVRD